MEPPKTPDDHPSRTIITALCIYTPFLAVGLIIFEIIQSWLVKRSSTENVVGWTYAARRRADTSEACPPAAQRSYKPLGWIWTVFRTTDDEIFEYCGLDTLCFLRTLRMGTKFGLCGILLSALLFPLYATAKHRMNATDPLERITMSGLEHGESRIWASVFAMYVMSFLAFYLFAAEYKVYIQRRHQFLGQLGAQQYSVVINDLPLKYRTPQNLMEYWRHLYPNAIQSCHVALECASLEKMVKKRVRVIKKLEIELAKNSGAQEPTEMILTYENKLKSLNIAIYEEIGHVLGHGDQNPRTSAPITSTATAGDVDVEAGGGAASQQQENHEKAHRKSEQSHEIDASRFRPSAFVSFTTLQSAQSAQQLLQTENTAEMEVLPAPHSTDIFWKNYGLAHRRRKTWQLISLLLTILIILFWTIPSSFVASLASVQRLKELIPGLEDTLKEAPWLAEVLKQLSPLGLYLMSVLAYYIFGFLSRREGHASGNQVSASHFGKLVYFQTFQIFFVSVIAGTVFDNLNEIIKDPTRVFALLEKMPGQAITFMEYIIFQATLKLALELLMVVRIILGLLHHSCAPKRTERQRKSSWLGFIGAPRAGQGKFNQTGRLPNYFLAMLLVFAFCAIAPLLSYFAFFFFLASDIVYRRQVLFVYDPDHGTTGVFWPQLHSFLVGGLMLAQVIFLCLTSFKVAPGPITLATILPFFTVAYFYYSRSRWPRIAMNLPLNKCWELDVARSRNVGPSDWDRVYIQPALGEGEAIGPESDISLENTVKDKQEEKGEKMDTMPTAETDDEKKELITAVKSG